MAICSLRQKNGKTSLCNSSRRMESSVRPCLDPRSPTPPPAHVCPECGAKFEGQKQLKKHSTEHRRLADYMQAERAGKGHDDFICLQCDARFDMKKKLTAHLKSHDGFVCPKCPARLDTQAALSSHMQLHALSETVAHDRTSSNAHVRRDDGTSRSSEGAALKICGDVMESLKQVSLASIQHNSAAAFARWWAQTKPRAQPQPQPRLHATPKPRAQPQPRPHATPKQSQPPPWPQPKPQPQPQPQP
jgi:hypothetical protein